MPPLYDSKIAVVISPTISLMTDQVCKLTELGVKATFLGSAQKEDVSGSIKNGDYHIVYSTPESFYNKSNGQPRDIFLELSRQKKLSFLAIDDAYLISCWKYFRYSSTSIRMYWK